MSNYVTSPTFGLLIAAGLSLFAASPQAGGPSATARDSSPQAVDAASLGHPITVQNASAPQPLPGEPHTYDNEILYAARTYARNPDPLFPLVIKAIIAVESNFDPSAKGDPETCEGRSEGDCGPYRGDPTYTEFASIGLMQYNRWAHTDSRGDLRDPGQNILASVEILDVCWRQSSGGYQAAIRCYNGDGPGSYAYAGRVVTVLRPLAIEAGLADAL